MRDSLLQDRVIRETLNRAVDAIIALLGMGSIHADLYSLKRAGYIGQSERQVIEKMGMVGDVCGHQYTIQEECPNIDINQRIVAIDIKTLSAIVRAPLRMR